jgi:hypothetical protein
MRAKMVIDSVVKLGDEAEQLTLRAVCKNEGYGEDGKDENNTFATFTPSADLAMTINNPDLIGKFSEGQTFYVDFTEVAA